MAQEILNALKTLESERGIPHETLLHSIEDAMTIAYRKTPEPAPFFQVRYDDATDDFRVFEQLIPSDLLETVIIWPEEEEHDGRSYDPATGERRERRHAQLDFEMLEIYRGDIPEQDVTPDNFGRVAALTARQVISQRLRDFDQDQVYEEFAGREGELVIGMIQQGDRRHTLVQLRDGVEALLPRSEQVDGERYRHGTRIRAVIKDVERTERGCSIILSRRSPELVRQLFLQEVPEASNGLIEITRVVRDAGVRSKIGVISIQSGIDPVGACVGPRGSRVRNVVTELGGEKVDIVPLDVDPARFLAKSLSPAQVREVEINDEEQRATVIVPDDEVARAIGQRGQNVRLTAKLTGWKIDILSQSQYAQQQTFEAEETEVGGEDHSGGVAFDGRCGATLGNGRRCPNMALVNSHYCGLPRHAALVHFPTNSVKILHGIDNSDVQKLLDGVDIDAIVIAAESQNESVFIEEAEAQDAADARAEAIEGTIAAGADDETASYTYEEAYEDEFDNYSS